MTAQEKCIYFKNGNWVKDYRDGLGYENLVDNKWYDIIDYEELRFVTKEFEEKLVFLAKFRSECLPFGEYPDYILLEFLNKHFANKTYSIQ